MKAGARDDQPLCQVNHETVDGPGHFFLLPSSPGLHCFDTVEKHLIEMDVSLADISSLPLSVGSAGDMHRCERQDSEADMEIATSEAGQST